MRTPPGIESPALDRIIDALRHVKHNHLVQKVAVPLFQRLYPDPGDARCHHGPGEHGVDVLFRQQDPASHGLWGVLVETRRVHANVRKGACVQDLARQAETAFRTDFPGPDPSSRSRLVGCVILTSKDVTTPGRDLLFDLLPGRGGTINFMDGQYVAQELSRHWPDSFGVLQSFMPPAAFAPSSATPEAGARAFADSVIAASRPTHVLPWLSQTTIELSRLLLQAGAAQAAGGRILGDPHCRWGTKLMLLRELARQGPKGHLLPFVRRRILTDSELRPHFVRELQTADWLDELQTHWKKVARSRRRRDERADLVDLLGRVGHDRPDVALPLLLRCARAADEGDAHQVLFALERTRQWQHAAAKQVLMAAAHRSPHALSMAAYTLQKAFLGGDVSATYVCEVCATWVEEAPPPGAGVACAPEQALRDLLRAAHAERATSVLRVAPRILESEWAREAGRRPRRRRGGVIDDTSHVWLTAIGAGSRPAHVAREAVLEACAKGTPHSRRAVKALFDSEYLGCRAVALEAAARAPKAYAEEVTEAIEGGALRHPSGFLARRAMAAAFPFASNAQRRRMESAAMRLRAPRRAREDGNEERLLALEAIPEPFRSAKTSKTTSRLRERLPHVTDAPPFSGPVASVVLSPVPAEALAGMSDHAVVELLKTHGATTEDRLSTEGGRLVGGYRQLSQEVQELVRQHSERAPSLARRFAAEPMVEELYRAALPLGLREKAPDHPDLAAQCFLALAGDSSSEVRKWSASLTDRAAPHLSPQARGAALRALGKWASDEEDPTPDRVQRRQFAGRRDLLEIGINTARGTIAEAIVALLALYRRPPDYAIRALRRLAADPTGAVRACVMFHLHLLNPSHYALAKELFAICVDGCEEAVLAHANRFLPFIDVHDYDTVAAPLLERMVTADVADVRGAAGFTMARLSLGPKPSEELVAMLRSADLPPEAARGAAEVFAANLPNPKHQPLCLSHLESLAQGHDEARSVAAHALYRHAAELKQQPGELAVLIAGTGGSSAVDSILKYAEEVAAEYPCLAAEVLAAFFAREDEMEMECLRWNGSASATCSTILRHPDTTQGWLKQTIDVVDRLLRHNLRGAKELFLYPADT